MTHKLQLTDGSFAQIDEIDLETVHTVEFSAGLSWTGRICDRRWRISRKSHTDYVTAMLKSTIELRLHRVIMDAKLGQDIDHIDNDGRNNTRANLRLATKTQNNANRRIATGRDGFKGVCLHRNSGKFEAYIRIDGKKHHLGLHETAEIAAHVYDAAALKAWGEFAKLNFPVEQMAGTG